jgi:hypothetical protein
VDQRRGGAAGPEAACGKEAVAWDLGRKGIRLGKTLLEKRHSVAHHI